MPSSNLAAYLAKNYLTASTPASLYPNEPPKKKRKKSKHQATSGLVIADDDEDLSLSASHGAADNDELDTPVTYEGKVRSAEFRKAKKNTWKSLSTTELPTTTTSTATANQNDGNDDDDNEADALLRTAQSEESRRLAEQEAENAPTIVEDTDTIMTDNTPKMENGMKAGLQTAADTARMIAAEEEEEALTALSSRKPKKKQKSSSNNEGNESTTLHEQTIYRDATGRRIDLTARKSQLETEERDRARQAQQEKLSNMGEVQRRDLEQRRQDLDEAKFLTIGRTVDDEEYNDRLRDVVRWDDPMAAYMAEKNRDNGDDEDVGKRKGKGDGKVKRSVVKTSQFSAQPNRYGIQPGWRWDGVDRGNGFEKEWFQARSRRGRNEALSYEWQMDE